MKRAQAASENSSFRNWYGTRVPANCGLGCTKVLEEAYFGDLEKLYLDAYGDFSPPQFWERNELNNPLSFECYKQQHRLNYRNPEIRKAVHYYWVQKAKRGVWYLDIYHKTMKTKPFNGGYMFSVKRHLKLLNGIRARAKRSMRSLEAGA